MALDPDDDNSKTKAFPLYKSTTDNARRGIGSPLLAMGLWGSLGAGAGPLAMASEAANLCGVGDRSVAVSFPNRPVRSSSGEDGTDYGS